MNKYQRLKERKASNDQSMKKVKTEREEGKEKREATKSERNIFNTKGNKVDEI